MTEKEEDAYDMAAMLLAANEENSLLRSGNKHILRAGVIQLEIVPTESTPMKEIMNEFTKFLENINTMYGKEHLIARIHHGSDDDSDEEGGEHNGAGEMFG